MAAITSAGSGNWNSTTANAPWPSGVVPVSGDTVTIANGHTITVPVGYTAVCGSSPANDTGTAALKCSSASTGTGVLNVNGTFQYRGPVRMGAASWTIGAGGTLTYDASGATTPSAALYTWQTIGAAATGGSSKLIFSGSSGSHCTVNSVGNVQSGGFGNKTTAFDGGGQITATYTDFSYQGAATSSGNFINSSLNSGAILTLDNCTLDHCAQIQVTGPFNVSAGIAPDATFRLQQTKITNPANTTFTLQIFSGGATFTTGVRLVQFCDIAGQCAFAATDGGGLPSATSFTFKHNIFRVIDLRTTAIQSNVVDTGQSSVAAWDQNLGAMITASTSVTQDPCLRLGGGPLTNSYMLRLPVPGANGANMHPVYLEQIDSSVTFTGWVLQNAVNDTQGDILNLDHEATSARTVQVKNCVFLPNYAGHTGGSLLNQQGGVNQTQTVITFDHNTALGDSALPDTATVWGVGCEAGTTWPAGAVASIRSNLLYLLASSTGTIANSANSATVASGAITVADYNASYNNTNSIYGNPSGAFASTPGTHDVTGNPLFVDRTRSLLTFDQGYSGAAVGTAWVTSHGYVVGDIASSAVAGWYANQTQNWRCVVAHTSGATTQPGSGANFTSNWEPACLKTISDDILAGNTYSGGTNSLIGELVQWTKNGFKVQNSALNNAGHDGVTIGAMAFLGSGVARSVTVNQAVKRAANY